MKLISLIAAILMLCACAPFVAADGREAPASVLQSCQYEAARATAGNPSAAAAGWIEADLIRRCMAMSGYWRKN